jgi:hypothetical protein
MITMLLYAQYVVLRYYKDKDEKDAKEKLELFADGCSLKTFHSAMFNMYFLYRRFLYIVVFVVLQDYASIQVLIVTMLTVVNFIYTFSSRPYKENNVGEILNEFAILLCAYLINTFMLKIAPADFLEKVGWAYIIICT